MSQENNLPLTLPLSSPISVLKKKHGGRLPGLYSYEIVTYAEKEYAIISIQHKKNEVRFIVDGNHLTKVLTNSWHLSSGKYIATHYTLADGKSKEMYLHNFIKDNCMNESPESMVIHINSNMLDNRSENLRIVKSTDYFPLRNNRKRLITLPPDAGFTVDDIPKYLTFMKANGEHGARFAIEIPQLHLFMKLPSSKKVPLFEKFEEAKQKLNEIYENYPDINPRVIDALKIELNRSFEAILGSVKSLA
jgi:hypothetical protein